MICIRQDLIDKELSYDKRHYQKFHLSNRVIDNLKNKYYCHEMCENFYDTEPKFDDELFNMYLDYKDGIQLTGLSFWHIITKEDQLKETHKFSEQEHTPEELKAAYLKVKQMYTDYEQKRIEFNNWQEPYFEGNWNYSQQYVDYVARYTLEELQKINVKHDGRFYWSKDKDGIYIYFYGRDFMYKDYWFIFKRKE